MTDRRADSLVSIVVTTALGSDGLEGAIASALAQRHRAVEVLAVASGEAAVLAEASAVRVVAGEPGLPARQRNQGLREARGSALIFLEAGERLLPAAAAVGMRELESDPSCAFACGRCVVTRPYHADAEFPQQPLVTYRHYDVLLGRNYVLTPAAAVLRASALDAVGGFDETLEELDDYDLYLRLAARFAVRCHGELVAQSPARDPFREAKPAAAAALWSVLERQEPAVEGDPGRRRALSLGKRAWATRYELEEPTGGVAPAPAPPAPGRVSLGDLHRVDPLDTNFGYSRGTPVDRYYIESFLAEFREDVRGRVLEVQESAYTHAYGDGAVERSDVLSLLPDNPRATIVADLGRPEQFEEGAFDCAIVTQVLHLLLEPSAGVRAIHRMLKPGGVVLATVPGISQVEWAESWYWSFTVLSAKALFEEAFGVENVMVRAYGNALAATAFLWGLSVEELEPGDLDYVDPYYQATIAIRAVKPAAREEAGELPGTVPEPARGQGSVAAVGPRPGGSVILMYHRIAEAEIDPWSLAVAPGRFREQLELLRDAYDVVPLSRILGGSSEGRPRVAVTFDDGYADNLAAAAVLAELGLPATFFLVSGHIGAEREFWWDELAGLLLGPAVLPSSLSVALPSGVLEASLSDDGSPCGRGSEDTAWRADHEPASPRQRAYLDLYRALRPLEEAERDDALARLFESAGMSRVARADVRPLDSSELQTLASFDGVEIGGHTVTHPVLASLAVERQRHEIEGGRKQLHEMLGHPIDSFAYPHGTPSDFSTETVRIVAQAGYHRACAAVGGAIAEPTHPFQLPRLMVESWDGEELDRRLREALASGSADA